MTTKGIKIAHRLLATIVILTALAFVTMYFIGYITRPELLSLFLWVEAPLIIAALLIALWRIMIIRKSTGEGGKEILRILQNEEPALGMAVKEIQILISVIALVLGHRNGVNKNNLGFGYARGSMAIPIVVTGLTLLEVVIIHFIVPWTWLRIVLLIAAVYALLLIVGVLASRVTNPHLVSKEALTLQWGHKTVLQTPLTNIQKIELSNDYKHSQPAVDGDQMVLTSLTGTNVLVKLIKPAYASPPISKKLIPPTYMAREVRLYLETPSEFVQAVKNCLQTPEKSGKD